ncbi:MAG: response regulator [Plesiomonas sp.]|uniref:response regulator n=1 Tax=Plesiomonas sp. TaxID=2486279 RepID=UPI003F2C94C9
MEAENQRQGKVNFSGYHFMLVDDDPIFRQQLIHFIERFDGTVIEAQNGQYALDKLAHYKPDVVLCDLNMEVMGGIELVKILRAHGNKTPVIVISGSEKFSDVADALRAGASDYLTKPLDDLYILNSTIMGVLQTRKNNELEVEELNEYLQQLHDNPASSMQLIRQLMPPAQSNISHSFVRYRQINKAERMGLVFDLASLNADKFGFYVFDMSAAGRDGPVAALLLRTLFNGFLNHPDTLNFVLTHEDILRKIYQTFRQAGLTINPRLLIGSYQHDTGCLQLSVAGISVDVITAENELYRLSSIKPLGLKGSLQVETTKLLTEQWRVEVSSFNQERLDLHVQSEKKAAQNSGAMIKYIDGLNTKGTYNEDILAHDMCSDVSDSYDEANVILFTRQ